MAYIKDMTGCAIGYSDHTEGSWACIAAVAMGATVIEKHMTLGVYEPGKQDTFCSLRPQEFGEFVREIRKVEEAIKPGERFITEGERKTMEWIEERNQNA